MSQTINDAKEVYLESYSRSLELWPIDYTDYYVSTSFGETFIVECGDKSALPLILLHGASMSSTMWYPNVEKWAESYRIFAVDIIGDKNKSVPKKEFTNRADHAAWLSEVLDALQVAEADFVGLSFGALNLVNYLIYAPERVKKAALMSPAEAFVPFDPRFYSYAFGMVGNKEGVDAFLEWIFGGRYQLASQIRDQLTAGMMWIDTSRSSKPGNSGFPHVYSREELSLIQTPTLLLLGENEVMYNPQEAKERAVNTVRGIKAEIIKNAGHLLSLEKPGIVTDKVLEFLIEC
jgi:pimeloyl-ACP methyl ester carboxylesterase